MLRVHALCRVRALLDNIQQIAEHNNFFEPGFHSPSDLDQLPALYRRIIDDPATLHRRLRRLHRTYHTAHCCQSTALSNVEGG